MSALESLLRRRGTRRHPLDEVLPDGTPAAQVLMPRILRLPTEGEGVPLATPPVETPPPALDALLPALRPRRVFTPPEFEESAPTAVPEGVSYEPGTLAPRRRWSSPFNQETERNAAIRDVLSDPSQLPKAGKLERWLLNPLQRAAQGIAATGSLAGGLGGLGVGFVEGAVNPRAATQMKYQGKLAQSDQRLGQLQAQADAGLKRRGLMADIGLKEANAAKARREPAVKPNFQLRDTADGVVAVDMNDPTKPPTRVAGIKGAADSYDVYDDGTKVWAINRKNPRDRYALDDVATKPKPQLVSRTLKDGTVVQVPASTALTEEATIEAANITAGNQYGNQSYEDTVRRIDRENDDANKLYEDAQKQRDRVVSLYTALNQKIAERDAAATRAAYAPEDKPQDYAKEEAARLRANAEAEAIRKELEAANAAAEATGFVKRNPQTGWATDLGSRPTRKSYPSRQAPQMRQGRSAPPASPKRQGADPLGLFK